MRTRLIVASCAALVLLGTFGLSGGLGTVAAWNSAAPMSDAHISSGTLSMTVGDGSTQSKEYKFSGLSVSNLAPGDRHQAPLTVRNAGDVPMTFTIRSASSTGALAKPLHLRIDVADSAAACPVDGEFPGTPQTLVYEGTLAQVTATTPIGLAVAQSAALCFAVTMPAGAPQSLSEESATVAFTLRAESRPGA